MKENNRLGDVGKVRIANSGTPSSWWMYSREEVNKQCSLLDDVKTIYLQALARMRILTGSLIRWYA